MRRIIAALQTSLDGFIEGLMNANLVDELHLMVTPLVLGGGKALFKDVKERCALKLVRAKPLISGKVSLAYSTKVAQT